VAHPCRRPLWSANPADEECLLVTHEDLMKVLSALTNASVVTDPGNDESAHNGGPKDVRNLVAALGARSASTSSPFRGCRRA
jgi:hypothetical protein